MEKYKKVPIWIKKVIVFTQKFPDAELRNELLDELSSTNFDIHKFDSLCKNCHLAFNKYGNQILEPNNGAFYNLWEAIQVAGKEGSVKNMQGVLHDIFNNK